MQSMLKVLIFFFPHSSTRISFGSRQSWTAGFLLVKASPLAVAIAWPKKFLDCCNRNFDIFQGRSSHKLLDFQQEKQSFRSSISFFREVPERSESCWILAWISWASCSVSAVVSFMSWIPFLLVRWRDVIFWRQWIRDSRLEGKKVLGRTSNVLDCHAIAFS